MLDLVFQYLVKSLAGKNVSKIIYFVTGGTSNLDSITQSTPSWPTLYYISRMSVEHARGTGLRSSLVGCDGRHGRRRLRVHGWSTDDAERPVLGIQQVGQVLATTRDVELARGPVTHHQPVEVVQPDVASELDEPPQQAHRAAVAGRVHRRAALRDTTAAPFKHSHRLSTGVSRISETWGPSPLWKSDVGVHSCMSSPNATSK